MNYLYIALGALLLQMGSANAMSDAGKELNDYLKSEDGTKNQKISDLIKAHPEELDFIEEIDDRHEMRSLSYLYDTPLRKAIKHVRPLYVKLLLELGANPLTTNKNGTQQDALALAEAIRWSLDTDKIENQNRFLQVTGNQYGQYPDDKARKTKLTAIKEIKNFLAMDPYRKLQRNLTAVQTKITALGANLEKLKNRTTK